MIAFLPRRIAGTLAALLLPTLAVADVPGSASAHAPVASGVSGTSGAALALAEEDLSIPALPLQAASDADARYPFYMPMAGLSRPAIRLFVRCEASRAAGREVYAGRDAAELYGRAEGGLDVTYEARDRAGRPCVYPFAPWLPQIAGPIDGTQYILHSSEPGTRVTFATQNEWATINLRLFDIGRARVHFEMRDIALDFPGAIQPMGALHIEGFDGTPPGLLTAVLRRVRLYGGKNALFVPGGQTMLYVEDSDIAGNVGTSADQQHTTYINGTLVSHFRNSVWHGQHAWANVASGHQLKDKAYLRVYENVTVTNQPTGTTASAMPLVDASAFGFTWTSNLRLRRLAPAQSVRDALVDLRTEIAYRPPATYPWPITATPDWRMPADPLTALDRLYLAVFQNTRVESFRTEPFVFALRPMGTGIAPDGKEMLGNATTTPAQQRTLALAFGTQGTFTRAFAPGANTLANPALPPQARWVLDRDAFITHALRLIGR